MEGDVRFYAYRLGLPLRLAILSLGEGSLGLEVVVGCWQTGVVH